MIIKELTIDITQPAQIEHYLEHYVVNLQSSTDKMIYLERVGKQMPCIQEIGRLLLFQGQCRLDRIKAVIWVPLESYQWFQSFDLHRIIFIETNIPPNDQSIIKQQ